MSGVPNIEITESVEALQKLMKQQETGLGLYFALFIYCRVIEKWYYVFGD